MPTAAKLPPKTPKKPASAKAKPVQSKAEAAGKPASPSASASAPSASSSGPRGKATADKKATGDKKSGQKYTAEQIQVLEGLEPVRKRPGMYIGSTDTRGLHHCVYEIVDNAIDEAMAGHCDNVIVILHKDGSISVEDDGRGIPVDIHPRTKKPALEVVLTMLHAGGKFGGDDSGYKVSGGLHGVGSSVVNALSTDMRAEVYRDGKIYMQEYKRGKTQAKLKVIGNTKKHGTKIQFSLDPQIFDTLEFSMETLLNHFRQQAYLTRGISISVLDEREKRPEADQRVPRKYRFHFEGGVKSYVQHINEQKGAIGEVIWFEKELDEGFVEIAMQYTGAFQE